MRKIILLAMFASFAAIAQVSNSPIVLVTNAPSGSCFNGLPDQQVFSTGDLYSCQSGTWAQIGGGGGGGATLPSNALVFGLTSTTSRAATSSDLNTLFGFNVNQSPRVFAADSYTPPCTFGGTTYSTAADCAYGAALAYVTGASTGAIVRLGYGFYMQQISWLLPCISGSGNAQSNSISVKGEGSSVTFLQAQTGFTFTNPQIYRSTSCGSSNNWNQVSGLTLDANYTAPGNLSIQFSANDLIEDVTAEHSGPTTTAVDLGSLSNGSVSGSRVTNVNYVGTQGHNGRGADIQATVTSGAISGFTTGFITSSIAITAAGSGGTNGTFTWTTTSCSATGLPGATDPSGSFTVSGGSITAASNSTTAVGYMCPSTITISTSASSGLTGATLTETMAVGGSGYGIGTPGFTRGVYYGHAAGGSPCTTMPTNPPVLSFNGSGVLTGIALQDGTVASTGSGCTGPVFVWLYSGDPIQYAFSLGAVDLHYDGMIANAGWGACFNVTNGGASYNFLHPFDMCPVGIRDTAFSNFANVQCDSLASTCIDVTNGTSTIFGTRTLYDQKASYAGSSKIIYDSNPSQHAGGGQFVAGGTCGNANFLPSLYSDVIGATGPVSLVAGVTGAGTFPASQVYLDNTCASVANKFDAKVNLSPETAPVFIGPTAGADNPASSATPNFSIAVPFSAMALTANVTTFTLPAGLDGQDHTLCFRQGAEPFTVTPPSNVQNFVPVGNVNVQWYCQDFKYHLSNAIWLGLSPTGTFSSAVTVPQIIGSGSAPSCTVGAGAGTGATCSVTGTNLSHLVTLNTGTSPSASAVAVTVTFSGTLASAPVGCSAESRNANSAGQVGMIFTGAPSTTTYTINVSGSALPASTAGFIWSVLCI